MRFSFVLVTVLLTTIWLGAGNRAQAQHFPPVPRVHKVTATAVYYGGERVWRAKRRGERVITPVLSSRQRGAVAFATRTRRGSVTLIVVLVDKAVRGHVMTWVIPRRTHKRGRANVMWLGRSKVGFGYSPVRPVVVASWRVRQR